MEAFSKEMCKCRSEILIVDDNEFNLIPLESIINTEF